MSFTDILEGNELKQPETNQASSTDVVDFDSVVKKLKSNKNISISTLGSLLEELGGKINNKDSEEVMSIIVKLDKTERYEQIKKYIFEIDDIVKKYKSEKGETTDLAGDDERGLKEIVEGKIKDFFLDSASLNKIEDIDIKGKIENMAEFNKKLRALIKVVENDSNFKKLDTDAQSKVILGLKKIGTGLEEKTRKTMKFLDNKINNLARQVENQNEGYIHVNIEGEEIVFPSKKDAFEFVEMLKKEAEDEFQSIMTDLAENVGSAIDSVFSLKFLVIPHMWAADSIGDLIENHKDGDHWLPMTIDYIQVLFFSYLAVNYTETIYRRLVKDIGANLPFEWTKNRFRLGDFGRQRLVFQGGEDKEEVRLKERYNRRLDAIDYLKDNASNIKPEHMKAYMKEVKNIESYLNTNSRTFWLKFRALKDQHGIFIRPIAAFTRGWASFDIEKSQSQFITGQEDEVITKIKEGLEFVFDDVEVIKGDNGGKTINVGPESNNVKKLRDYIDTISDTNRRKSVLDNFEKYLERLKIEPKTIDIVKGEIFNIVENNYLDSDNIVNEINKKYFKDINVEEIERKGFFKWFKQAYDYFKGNMGKLNKVMVEVWGKYAPTSFTKGQALAIKFREVVKEQGFQGNNEDLKKIFDKIDSGKLELHNKYPGIKKVMVPFDAFKSVFGKYGIQMPKITNLNRYGNTKNITFEDLLKKGSERGEEIEKAKKIFSGEIVENLEHVFNLDSNRFPSQDDLNGYGKGGKEAYFEGMYNDYKKSMEEGTIRNIQYEVRLELVKMYDGYLTNQRVLKEIDGSFNKEQRVQKNIVDFIKKVETGKWVGTLRDLKVVIINLQSGETIDEKIINFDVESRIEEIKTEGVKFKEIDFMNQKFGIFDSDGKLDIKSYRDNEFELVKLSKILNGNIDSTEKLGVLFQTINRDKINYTSVEFFEELNKALGIFVQVDENTTRYDYKKILVSKIEPKLKLIIKDFDTKGVEEKAIVIEKLKGILGISKNDLSSSTTKALKMAGVNVGLYVDKITEFENEKEGLKLKETEDVKLNELEKKQKLEILEKQIGYLENIHTPKTLQDMNDAKVGLEKRDIFIKFEKPGIIAGGIDTSIAKNREIIFDKINQLRFEKLVLEKPELNNPVEYQRLLLNNIYEKLKQSGISETDIDVLDKIYAKVINGTEVDSLFKSKKIGGIYNLFEKASNELFSDIHYKGGLDTRLVRNIFEAIRKNGLRITR